MTQLPIALFPPVVPPLTPARARRTDPLPSQEAADTVNRGAAKHHEELIMGVLAGGAILTFHEIAARCGLEPVQVHRRLSDRVSGLLGRNLVEKVGLVYCRCCERRMAAWRATC